MKTRETLYKIYWKIQAIIVPSLKYSQDLYEEVLKSHVNPQCVWLDLGCGHQLLPSWRLVEEKKLCTSCKAIIGIDYDLTSLKKNETLLYKLRGDASHLPFKENSFDLITANMVVEHFDNPDVQFQQIYSLLKPGGLFIFHTPNSFGYPTIAAKLIPETWKSRLIDFLEARKDEDTFPTFYRVNSEFKIREFAQKIGFNIRKIRMIVSTAECAVILPIAILELLWIRILMTKPLKRLRTNIIAILQKT